eukprot:TRINITY_DN4859_c1_g1_i1.p2 TRINITY_DN4859_c1_g1~~TRINITY_DN4859_c1_g1_i1.p2  ORF type:complete len:205 (+),score=89.56 TRINITY_DN4859_c1_g1_i1:47-661(+)
MELAYEYLFKFIVIGDAATGKSCLLHRFLDGKFKKDSTHTIGVEFGSKVIEISGKNVKLQIWDTAGQERFRSVTRSYYNRTVGGLLVYDITSRESFNNINSWRSDASSLAHPDIVMILVGNKVDLDKNREVSFEEGSRYAEENGLIFIETSALSGSGVEEAFVKCAQTIVQKIETGKMDPGDAVVRLENKNLAAASQQNDSCSC